MRKNNRHTWPLQVDVAKALGVPLATVSRVCRRLGWSTRGSGHRPPLTPAQVNTLLEYFAPRVPKTTLERAKQMFHLYICSEDTIVPWLLYTHNKDTHTTMFSMMYKPVYTETHFVY